MRKGRLDSTSAAVKLFGVKNTYSVKEAQRHLPGLLRATEQGVLATITRHEKPVAHVLSAERFTALLETIELTTDGNFVREWKKEMAGRQKYLPLSALDE